MTSRQYGGRVDLQCERCGRQFTRPASRVKDHAFCSRECYFASEIPKANAIKANATRYPDGGLTEVACLNCGTRFQRFKSQAVSRRVFCSRECQGEHAVASPVRQINSNGYARVFVGKTAPGADRSGHILEHRKVMQGILGRPLLDAENIHHINGQRDDNRPENLELWSHSQPRGQRVKDKLRWAREFIATYENAPIEAIT